MPAGHINLPPTPCTKGLRLPVYLALPLYSELPLAARGPGQLVPAEHVIQAVALAELHVPPGQYVQPGAPATLNVPAGQVMHVAAEEAPEVVLYCPPAHKVHVIAPAVLQLPAGQIVLFLPDLSGQEYPVGQDMHVVDEEAPRVEL